MGGNRVEAVNNLARHVDDHEKGTLVAVSLLYHSAKSIFKRLGRIQAASILNFKKHKDSVFHGDNPDRLVKPQLPFLLDWLEDEIAQLAEVPKEVLEDIERIYGAQRDDPRVVKAMADCTTVLDHAKKKIKKYLEKHHDKLLVFRALHPKDRAHGASLENVESVLQRGVTSPQNKAKFKRDWELYLAMYIPEAPKGDFDLVGFWSGVVDRLPVLAPIARAWIAFPATSEVERTFSALSEILTTDRLSMKDDTRATRLSYMLNGKL